MVYVNVGYSTPRRRHGLRVGLKLRLYRASVRDYRLRFLLGVKLAILHVHLYICA